MRCTSACLTVLLGLFTATHVRAETLEEVEKKIIELTSKHKSAEMKMKMKTDVDKKEMTEKSETESAYIYAKKGDKWLSRTEIRSKGTHRFGDQPEQKLDTKMLSIYDGEYSYTLTETPEFKQATRSKMTTSTDPFSKEVWEMLRKHFDLKLLPDETVEGKSTWVIEQRPRPDAELSPEAKEAMKNTRSVTYYRKSDGAAVKSVAYDNDKPTMTMTLTDIKYDIEPRPDTFKFVAPEGVTVMDMDQLTAGQGGATDASASGAAAADSSEAPPEEKPREQAKAKEPPKEEEKPQETPKKDSGVKGLLKKLR